MSDDERRPEPPSGWPDVADPSGEPTADPDWRPYRSYPSPFFRALILLVCIGAAFLCIGAAAGVVKVRGSYAGADGSVVRWVIASVAATAAVGGGIWWAFLGVSFCPAGVVVQNWTRSWYVPWPQAMGFQVDEQGVWLITGSGPIRCQAFPLLRLTFSTLGRGMPVENFFLYPTVDRLQDEVRLRPRRRPRRRPSGSSPRS